MTRIQSQAAATVQPGVPDPEFQTWSHQHARENRRHTADLAQITQPVSYTHLTLPTKRIV